jgi:transcriptional regulator with XRE-family HTH domain
MFQQHGATVNEFTTNVNAFTSPRSKFAYMGTMGERIRAAREAKGWTQEQLAKIVGCTRPSITTWESDGVDAISHAYLTKLAGALGKSTEWILRGTEPKPKQAGVSQPLRLDIQTLARAIELVEVQVRLSRRGDVRPVKKARISAAIYAVLSGNEPGAERAVKQLLASILLPEETT